MSPEAADEEGSAARAPRGAEVVTVSDVRERANGCSLVLHPAPQAGGERHCVESPTTRADAGHPAAVSVTDWLRRSDGCMIGARPRCRAAFASGS